MKISFENPDKVNGLMTITVEEADYKDEVEKTLKDYRKRANVPGFRQGQVPMGLIKRQYGPQVKMEAINKILGENLQKYITDNKIQMLGQPMGSESLEAVVSTFTTSSFFKSSSALSKSDNIASYVLCKVNNCLLLRSKVVEYGIPRVASLL